MKLDNAHPFINYSTIRYNAASGISASKLTGALKITNNTISNNASSDDGGGIYFATDSGSTVTISNNTINNNTAADNGGGIYAVNPYSFYNEVTISSNTISNNTSSGYASSGYGGGIYIAFNGLVTVSNNTISNNTSSRGGGGIYTFVYYNTPNSISHNIIRDNTTSGDGGGIYTTGNGIVTISDNIISGNSSVNGGGIYAYAHTEGAVTISNNIASNNTASGSGGGISAIEDHTYYRGTVSIMNNSILKNTAQNNSAISFSSTGIGNSVGTCTYNTITDNQATGAASTATVYLNSLFSFRYHNLFGNTAMYELYNDTPAGSNQVDARNNWWGTAIESEIQNMTYDFFDDFNKGSSITPPGRRVYARMPRSLRQQGLQLLLTQEQ